MRFSEQIRLTWYAGPKPRYSVLYCITPQMLEKDFYNTTSSARKVIYLHRYRLKAHLDLKLPCTCIPQLWFGPITPIVLKTRQFYVIDIILTYTFNDTLNSSQDWWNTSLRTCGWCLRCVHVNEAPSCMSCSIGNPTITLMWWQRF